MEGAGYAFFSGPFTQTLYPLNLPLMAYYEWRGGYSQFDHQFFAIAGLGIYAIGLYLWLRRLESNSRAVFVAVLVSVVSFTLTELLRCPNAVHSAAWVPWILWGLTLTRFRRHHLRGPLVVCASSIMLVTAGYPYFSYYLIFLLPPYIVVALAASGRRVARRAGRRTALQRQCRTRVCCDTHPAAPLSAEGCASDQGRS